MRCPVCKGDNSQGPQCRRCKADLTLLFTLDEQRQMLLDQARRALASGQAAQGIESAEQADWLRSDNDSRRTLALAYLLSGQFSQAWEYYLSFATTTGQ